MDGDVADLPALVGLAEETGAILVVDEAHATGVLGASGAGLAELQGVLGGGHVTISTASKALGGLGGIVTGPRTVIEYLVNFARPLIYSTAAPPGKRRRLRRPWTSYATSLGDGSDWWSCPSGCGGNWRRGGLTSGEVPAIVTPIVPIVLGEATATVEASRRLWEAGYWVPAIRPPTVAPGSCRLRVSLRADLEDGDVGGLVEAMGSAR